MNFRNIKIAVVLLGILFLSINCNKAEIDIPNCIDAKIKALKNAPIQNPPAEVWKWEDTGKTYYYITSDCCDQYNYLYDENCEVVCAPDGGITGNGDDNCHEFSSEIVKILLWKDKRN